MDGTLPTHRDPERAMPGPAAEYEEMAVAAAYRRFLTEPGVEDHFHTARALVHRVPVAVRTRRALWERAAAAEVEAGRLARAHDEDQRHRFRFAVGVAIAVLLADVDAIPAYLAAQAFGLDLWTTAGITAVLVAALAAAMWVVTHHRSGWRRWAVVGVLAAGLAAIGALRWWYLMVTAGDLASALLDAVGLTIFTGLLVWFGVVVLSHTRTHRVSAAERRARSLRRKADQALGHEAEASRRADSAMREFMGRAQVFASRYLDEPSSRARFLERVRADVERDMDVSLADRSAEGGR